MKTGRPMILYKNSFNAIAAWVDRWEKISQFGSCIWSAVRLIWAESPSDQKRRATLSKAAITSVRDKRDTSKNASSRDVARSSVVRSGIPGVRLTDGLAVCRSVTPRRPLINYGTVGRACAGDAVRIVDGRRCMWNSVALTARLVAADVKMRFIASRSVRLNKACCRPSIREMLNRHSATLSSTRLAMTAVDLYTDVS